MMKALCQAPVGLTFPSSQKPQHVFFNSSVHRQCSQNQLVASKVCFMYNKKHKKLMATLSSLFGMSLLDIYDKFPESVWDICEDSSSGSLRKILALKQKMLAQDKSESNNSPDLTSDMDARFIESIIFDKTLYKYEILCRKTIADMITKQGLISTCDRDEIVYALDKIEEDIVLEKFEWRDGQDVHTNIMEALVNMVGERAKELTTTNQSDRCLLVLKTWCKDCIEQITTRIKRIQVALISLAIRYEGLVLPGTPKIEDNTMLESLILPIVKALDHDASDLGCYRGLIASSSNAVILVKLCCPGNDAYLERYPICSFADVINYNVPEHLMQMVKEFVSWRNLPFFIPNDDVVTYGTFLEKFRPNRTRRNDGFLALLDCVNIYIDCSTDDCDIEDARFYLFSSVENVLEMLDLCIKFAEGISFNQEKAQISPQRGLSDAISFAHFLTSKGLHLETSYALVHLCLKKQCQPSELTPHELQKIGFPCDHAHSLLLEKQIAFNSFTNQDSLKEMLIWCCKLQIDPQIIC